MRRAGGGRKSIEEKHPEFAAQLERLLEPHPHGDSESPLRWSCKSTRMLAKELGKQQIWVCHEKVAQALRKNGYRLRGNCKAKEGASQHSDGNAQFETIHSTVRAAWSRKEPVISVDTQKKEWVGNHASKGQPRSKSGKAKTVNGHDGPVPVLLRACPYGVYDLGCSTGFMNVGVWHDTATFAVDSIRRWWRAEGHKLYARSQTITITADGGGRQGCRLRLWKVELQKLADYTGRNIVVCHFPPGTSKWSNVEHRLFSFISSNWCGEPLGDYETVVSLIARSTTAKGLSAKCRLDRTRYATGKKVSRRELAAVNLNLFEFHDEWNYTIRPTMKPVSPASGRCNCPMPNVQWGGAGIEMERGNKNRMG